MAFKTKKSLGQHFLTDKNILHKITDAVRAQPGDRIIEIGPGTGALTHFLAEKFEDIHAVEIDRRAAEVLQQSLPQIKVLQQDVLKADWPALADTGKSVHVAGNLPYYITSPILFALLEHRNLFKEAVLMMQKEVAERLVAKPAGKQYGILSVQTQLFSSPELLFHVSPNSFSPPPKVMSSVVRLVFNKGPLPYSDGMLKKIVRTAFNQRRKKLSNSLKPLLGENLPPGFNFDERAEHWPPETYANLAEFLEQADKIS